MTNVATYPSQYNEKNESNYLQVVMRKLFLRSPITYSSTNSCHGVQAEVQCGISWIQCVLVYPKTHISPFNRNMNTSNGTRIISRRRRMFWSDQLFQIQSLRHQKSHNKFINEYLNAQLQPCICLGGPEGGSNRYHAFKHCTQPHFYSLFLQFDNFFSTNFL